MKKIANQNDKRMTVREVADALGLSPDTIYNSARELYPEAFSPGKTTYLTEAQATAVKLNLRKNSEVVMQPKTDLEKALLIQQAMQFQQEIIEKLQERIAEQDQVITYQAGQLVEKTQETADANRHADYAVHFMSKEMLGKLDKIRSERTVRLPYKED